jgi:hypothetical protein
MRSYETAGSRLRTAVAKRSIIVHRTISKETATVYFKVLSYNSPVATAKGVKILREDSQQLG